MELGQESIRMASEEIGIDWQTFFTRDELDRMGRQTGFVKRNSDKNKLTGSYFLDLIALNPDILSDQSLRDLCTEFQNRFGIGISPQALNERFNSAAVEFLKTVLERIIRTQIQTTDKHLPKTFGRILIKDSTCFQVSHDLVKKYPGSGGAGSNAAVRIQFEYDLLNGSIVDLSLSAFNEQDAKNSKNTLDKIDQGDLVVRDLAYMGVEVLGGIKLQKASFLCRLGSTTAVFERKSNGCVEKLDFTHLYTHMRQCGLTQMKKNVFLTGNLFPVRLLIYLLPSDVVAKRVRDKRQEATKKGRPEPTKKFRVRQNFNLLITNTSDAQISLEAGYEIYRLRWQVELIFKSWKSLFAINKVKDVKLQRLECYIYGKLILLMIGWRLFCALNAGLYQVAKVLLSQYKFFKAFRRALPILRNAIGVMKISLLTLMTSLNKAIDHLRLNKKKNDSTPFETVTSFLCIQENGTIVDNRHQA